MQIKEQLIATNQIINNEYLDKYCNLINSNFITKKVKFKTQQHHIIPKFIYKILNKAVDNTKANIINLSYQDHCLAHYYLALCSKTSLCKYNNFIAIRHIIGQKQSVTEQVFIESLPKYQELYEASKQHMSLVYKGKKLSEAQKQKIRASMLGKFKGKVYVFNQSLNCTKMINKDLLEEYLKAGWIKGNGQKNKTVSPEVRKKISENTKAAVKKWKDENPDEYKAFCKAIGEKNRGKKLSVEAKQKISKANSGTNNGMYGKISPRRKKVYCTELDKIFNSIAEAELETGCYHSHISACCKGKLKSVNGYHWSYVIDETFTSR